MSGTIGIVEAKIKAAGKNILEITAQVSDWIIPPYSPTLITQIDAAENIGRFSFQKESMLYEEFMKKLYEFHRYVSLDESCPCMDSSAELNINIRRAQVIVD